MKKVSGGELVAKALVKRGVEYVFGISGGHIVPIQFHLDRLGVKQLTTRHEQSAVFMAEAWGRMSRRPGVALVTAGPGFTNALTAIQNAALANSPLLLISGVVGISMSEKLDLQDMRQLPVIEPIVKKAFVCQKTERIPEFVDMAWRAASTGRPGPVYLELPADILNAQVDSNDVNDIHTSVVSRPIDPVAAGKLMEMINSAERPIVIAGSGAHYSDASMELTTFIENTGIPVFTSTMGRGVIPDTHPLCFESSLSIRPGAAFFGTATADLIILLGTRISMYYATGDIFDKAARIVQVDIDPWEIGRNRSIELGVVSDIKAFLAECNRIIDKDKTAFGPQSRFKAWVDTLKQEEKKGKDLAGLNWESKELPMHPMRLCKEIDTFMDREDDIVIGDGGDTQVWVGMTRTARKSGYSFDSGLYGCLGVGLPYANAAKLLHPDKRVLLVIGDGSTGFNFMEFFTAIRKEIPIVVVINNDCQWGMIRHSQEIKLKEVIDETVNLGEVHYERLVEDLGGKGFFVERPEEMASVLEEAFACGRPACINVMTDPGPVSPGSVALAMIGGMTAEEIEG
ncbi:MAG: thiamine pyrophosphate-binding protein [Thermodesulfobacteriota bacterium]|nr:thiamine pyrophosphate-binding protein [Thermodesulfobacteriota bacterium]